jgi:type IV secretory pathway VirB10-like protein
MTTEPPFSPEVRALVEREREIQPLSAAQRARAMARARAALVTPIAAPVAPPRLARAPRWVAAAAAVVCSAAAAAAAYELHDRLWPAKHAPVETRATVAVRPAIVPKPPVVVDEVALPPVEEPRPSAPSAPSAPSKTEATRAELRLLRQARAAVARGDFAGAMAPITEHARRFKKGRLVEEREALRIKALAGLGRTEEARRAAASFRARFPRSVLLPAVSKMSASP